MIPALLAPALAIAPAVRAVPQNDPPAADTPPPAAATGDDIEIDSKIGVWFPRLKGDAGLDTGEISFEDQLDLADSESVFTGELTLRKDDRWTLLFTAFDFSTEASGRFIGNDRFGSLDLSPGDPYHAEVDFTSVGVEFGARILHPVVAVAGDPAHPVDIQFIARLGVRYLDVDQTIEAPGQGVESAGGEWMGLYGGADLRLQYAPPGGLFIADRIILEAGIAAGPAVGGDDGSMWQVRAGLRLEVVEGLGLYFGFRLVEMDVENEGYTFDAGLQGLFLGGTVRF
jgi:hypothetical protein